MEHKPIKHINNMDIIKTIESYIQNENIEGAILINGEWGIGKSTFWRNTVTTELEKIKPVNSDKNYECIYVSLNGIRTTEDILTQISLAKLPFLKSKTAKIATTIGSVLVNIIGRFPKITESIGSQSLDTFSSIKLEDLMNFSNNIICFDDLERISEDLSIKEVLGFINTHFIETKRIKTVILVNELEINNREEYFKIKEKLVTRSIHFTENQVPFSDILKRFDGSKSYSDFLLAHEPYIKLIISEFKQKNLRTIIFSLDILKSIFECIDSLINELDLAESVIFLALIISFEFKSGSLKSEDYGDYKNLNNLTTNFINTLLTDQILAATIKNKATNKDQEIYAKKFHDKYKIGGRNEYYFFKSIYNYILCGYLNKVELTNEIKEYKKWFEEQKDKNQSKAEDIVLDKLRNPYWMENDNELDKAIKQLIYFIQSGRYQFFHYPTIYNRFLSLTNENLLDHSIEHYISIILDGLRKSLNNDHILSINNLSFIMENVEKTGINEIDNLIEQEYHRLMLVGDSLKVNKFLTTLETISTNGPIDRTTLNIFQYLSPTEFLNKIKAFNAAQWRNVVTFFAEYNEYANPEALNIDPLIIGEFNSLIIEYQKDQHDRILIIVLNKLIQQLNTLKGRLEDS